MKKNYGYRVRNDKEVIASPLFEGDKIFDDETQEMWEIENNKHWRAGNIALAALKAMNIVMMSSTGGAAGQQGVQGVPGADGIDGLPGANGTNGTDGVDGAIGHDGSQGIPGIDGLDGTNGTGVVIMGHEVLGIIQATDGAAGDMWIDQATGHGWVSNGLGAGAANWLDIGQIEGPAGPTGANGADGSQGIPGVDGAPGAPGVDGSDGTPGIQGTQGIDGVQGVPGVDGQDGADGTNGVDGVDAIDTFTIVDKVSIDLDTLTDNGLFFADGSNRPPHTTKGVLEIRLDEATGHTIQTFQSSSYTSYIRAYDGTSWSTWEQTETSNMLGLLMHMVIGKANKSSLPTIYSGEAAPLDTLGKDYDRYHRFEAGSAVNIDLYDGISVDGYNPNIFTLMADFKGSPVQNDIVAIDVAPSNHIIFVDLDNNATLPVEELTLQIAGTDIPLTVLSNAAGSLTASYDQTNDAVMEAIVSGTSFKLIAKEGVSTPLEYDYEKYMGTWIRNDFVNIEIIEDTIREFSTVVHSPIQHINNVSRDECIAAFKLLPNFDWTKNDRFFIIDVNDATRMVSVSYISDGATDEASAGPFYTGIMMQAT